MSLGSAGVESPGAGSFGSGGGSGDYKHPHICQKLISPFTKSHLLHLTQSSFPKVHENNSGKLEVKSRMRNMEEVAVISLPRQVRPVENCRVALACRTG